MKRRSFWKSGLYQVYFSGRNAFFLKEDAFEKYNKMKKIKWLKMNATSTKKNKKM